MAPALGCSQRLLHLFLSTAKPYYSFVLFSAYGLIFLIPATLALRSPVFDSKHDPLPLQARARVAHVSFSCRRIFGMPRHRSDSSDASWTGNLLSFVCLRFFNLFFFSVLRIQGFETLNASNLLSPFPFWTVRDRLFRIHQKSVLNATFLLPPTRPYPSSAGLPLLAEPASNVAWGHASLPQGF